MATVAVPASPNETYMSPALGKLEWETYGGKVKTTYHPGGRVSHLYVTPNGKVKLRSWRQAQKYMEENKSGPLAQEAQDRRKNIMKRTSKPCSPEASQKKRKASSSQSAKSKHQRQTTEAASPPYLIWGLEPTPCGPSW